MQLVGASEDVVHGVGQGMVSVNHLQRVHHLQDHLAHHVHHLQPFQLEGLRQLIFVS